MILKKFTNIFVPPDKVHMPARRHDLDWLRILLFALLIIHHIGMFYVQNWGWHAKSQYNYQWLESILLIVEPWRMPAIWFISGIAIRFILAKVSCWRYIALRSYRLLLPLLFGILVVVPPQLYIEMTAKAEITMNYWQFLHAFFSDNHQIFSNYQYGIWPHIDVNHLWYLRSLWYYSLYLLILMPVLNSQFIKQLTDWLAQTHGAITLLSLTIPIALIQLLWPMDTARYPLGFTFLLYGYLLGWHQGHWQKLHHAFKPLGLSYVMVSFCFIGFYNLYWLDVIHDKQVPEIIIQLGMILYAIARVIGLLVIMSCTRFLAQKTSASLRYFNDAVYPFYILHQTIIVVTGYYLTQLTLGGTIESFLLVLSTICFCFLGFEIIRRSEFLRPFFGLTLQKQYPKKLTRIGFIASAIVISPLILRLI